jgi:SM-20-related protein
MHTADNKIGDAETVEAEAVRIASELARCGWSVSDEFFGTQAREIIDALACEIRTLHLNGRLQPAGIGRGAGAALRPEIRGDFTRWLDEGAVSPAAAGYRKRMEALRDVLNRELFLGLSSLEAHFAAYPPGAFYRLHLDRFASSDERAISTTLYLNEDWREADGGELRLDLPKGRMGILPVRGRLVVFRSDAIRHEVAQSRRERFSLTGWFRRRPVGRVV